MRNDERFEIERAFDLLPHVIGCSWASIWFRLNEVKAPTRKEFREKTIEYFEKIQPSLNCFPNDEVFQDIKKYIEIRKNEEIQKIINGLNKEVEKRYDRYIDYG